MKVFSTARALREFLADFAVLHPRELPPRTATLGDFFASVVIAPNLAQVSRTRRVILMQEAASELRRRRAGSKTLRDIPEEFFAFLQNGGYLFAMRNELLREGVTTEQLKMSDLNAEFDEHFEILGELFALYESKLAAAGFYDKIPPQWELNGAFLAGESRVEIALDGVLSGFECGVLRRVAAACEVVVGFECDEFRRDLMQKTLGKLGVAQFLDVGWHYEIDVGRGRVRRLGEIGAGAGLGADGADFGENGAGDFGGAGAKKDVKFVAFSQAASQNAFVFDAVSEMVAAGIEPAKIAVILPRETSADMLYELDVRGEFKGARMLNFAMGLGFEKEREFLLLSALESAFEADLDGVSRRLAQCVGAQDLAGDLAESGAENGAENAANGAENEGENGAQNSLPRFAEIYFKKECEPLNQGLCELASADFAGWERAAFALAGMWRRVAGFDEFAAAVLGLFADNLAALERAEAEAADEMAQNFGENFAQNGVILSPNSPQNQAQNLAQHVPNSNLAQGFGENLAQNATQNPAQNPAAQTKLATAKCRFERAKATYNTLERVVFELREVCDLGRFCGRELMRLLTGNLARERAHDNDGGGVSVMGVLESRGARLDGVVVVDFNDDIVPARVAGELFLNSQLRRRAGLILHEERENLQRSYYASVLRGARMVRVACVKNDERLPSRFAARLGLGEPQSASAEFDALLARRGAGGVGADAVGGAADAGGGVGAADTAAGEVCAQNGAALLGDGGANSNLAGNFAQNDRENLAQNLAQTAPNSNLSPQAQNPAQIQPQNHPNSTAQNHAQTPYNSQKSSFSPAQNPAQNPAQIPAQTLPQTTPQTPQFRDLTEADFFGADGKMPISFSRYDCFNDCKLHYFYRYVLGVGEVRRLDNESNPLTLGNAAHKAFERLFAQTKNRFDVAKFSQIFTKVARESGVSEFDAACFLAGADKIARLMRGFFDTGFVVYECEKSLTESVGEFVLTGKIDCILWRQNGVKDEFKVLDFKTGRVKDDTLQLVFYEAMMRCWLEKIDKYKGGNYKLDSAFVGVFRGEYKATATKQPSKKGYKRRDEAALLEDLCAIRDGLRSGDEEFSRVVCSGNGAGCGGYCAKIAPLQCRLDGEDEGGEK